MISIFYIGSVFIDCLVDGDCFTSSGLICSGGGSLPPKDFLKRLWEQVNISGARGAATGRNIHQKTLDDAVKMCAACHAIICNGASVDEALGIYNS